MSTEDIILIIGLIIQVSGFCVIIFKGGKYIGQSNEMFLGVFHNMKRMDTSFEEHVKEDDRKHESAAKEIADLRVAVALRQAGKP